MFLKFYFFSGYKINLEIDSEQVLQFDDVGIWGWEIKGKLFLNY